jgi:hypothetical protein
MMTSALALYASSFLVGALLSARINVIGFGMLILAATGLVAVVNVIGLTAPMRWDHFLGTWVMVQAGYVAFGILFPPPVPEEAEERAEHSAEQSTSLVVQQTQH